MDLRSRRPELNGLTAAHLAELIAEVRPLALGRRLRDVLALPPSDLLLVFEPESDEGPHLRVRVSADGGFGRVHVQHDRMRRSPGPFGPFFRRAAAELSGALLEMEALAGDRIVRLTFDGTSSGARRTLLAELFGPRANLLLLDENDTILAVLRAPKGRETGRLSGGIRWSAPPSPPARQDAAPAVSLVGSLPAPEEPPPASVRLAAPLSWCVEASLGRAAAMGRTEDQRARLRQRVARRRKRLDRTRRQLERALEEAERAEELRRDGELLKVHLREFRRGAKAVELDDFETGGKRVIELDPTLSPVENAERLFTRYRKLKRKGERVPGELELVADRIRALDELARRAEEPDTDLETLAAEALRDKLLEPDQAPPVKKARRAPTRRLPYKEYAGSLGSPIWVGRSAADNDALSLRHGRGNDVWLHTADAPGSHVVLRLEKGREPDPGEVLDAAHLAAHFSPLRDERRVRVHVARCKDVRKPRGAKPGLVHLKGGKVIDLRIEPARLGRLLGRRPS